MDVLFSEVVSQFQSTHQYDKFIKEVQKEYDVKIYRLSSFSRDHACNVYQELHEKYASQELTEKPQGWYENQRRLYVWFIVCFIHLKMLEPNKLLDGQKHWKNISATFHSKNTPFLKYQLQTLLKNKGRTTWKEKQDQLLREAYKKFEKGEWNEVAKYFFFQSDGKFFKTPKQCRERWQNHLNQTIKKGQWTPEEDYILFDQVKRCGTHWASIIPELNNTRTEHMIKNRYKSVINRLMQEENLNERQAVLEALRRCESNQEKNSEDNRDEKGVLQCESEVLQEIEEEEQVIEKPKKTQKKRGRPRKEKVPEIKIAQSFRLRDRNQSKNNGFSRNGQIILDNNSSFKGHSLSKANPNLFENIGNPFLKSGTSHPEFFNSSRFSFNRALPFQDDRSVFINPMSSRLLKSTDSFKPILLEGESLRPSRRFSFNKNQSLISGLMKFEYP